MQSPRGARVRRGALPLRWERSTRPRHPAGLTVTLRLLRPAKPPQPRRPGVEPYLDAESEGPNAYREKAVDSPTGGP